MMSFTYTRMARALKALAIMALLLALIADNAMAQLRMYVHELTVVRHINTPLTNAQVDGIFATCSDLLKVLQRDCGDEVACCVEMHRDGAVGTFGAAGDGLDVITSETELDAVFAIAGNFKAVTHMQDCCGESGNILGCGKVGVENTVIVASTTDDVWVHEFGHNKGLPHRNDCAKNIMHSANLNTTSVNQTECDAFKAGAVAMVPPTIVCRGTVCTPPGNPGPRQYAYEVTAGANAVSMVDIGTCDPNLANYANILKPADWTVEIIDNNYNFEHHIPATIHGNVIGPNGLCEAIIRFSAGTPMPPGVSFVFGFDHDSVYHDVAWSIDGGAATVDWTKPVGCCEGPVHSPICDSLLCGLVGDADASGGIDIDDVVYTITYIFGGGDAPIPCPVASGDADCSCAVDIDDAVYIITYIFGGGMPPCSYEDWLTICGK